jgi:Family of unknown function (DUF5715)
LSNNFANLLSPAGSAATLVALSFLATASVLTAQSLQGSHESVVKQETVAQQNGFAYLRTTAEVVAASQSGTLLTLTGNEDYQLAEDVSFPYARAEVKGFVEEVAHRYAAACGEPLVVTSLTRPMDHQPWNASPLSVHPTGMAVDLRRSFRPACRRWLENALLMLEGKGLIEATRESFPAHYHVSVFPDQTLLSQLVGEPIAQQPGFAVVAHRSHGRVRVGQVARVSNRRIAHRRHSRSTVARAVNRHRKGGATPHRTSRRGGRVRAAH